MSNKKKEKRFNIPSLIVWILLALVFCILAVIASKYVFHGLIRIAAKPTVVFEPSTENNTETIEIIFNDANASATETTEEENAETSYYNAEADDETKDLGSDENLLSSHMILIDTDENRIVAQKGAYDRISPASMTKVLTLLVAAEAVGTDHLGDTVTISQACCDYVYVNDCSVAGFSLGEKVTIKDLFYGIILPSGADAVYMMEDYVAGSPEAFVDLMNQKLEDLGLSDTTHFTNAIGLYNENHYSTCYDIAVIMQAAMQNDFCREVLGTHVYTTAATSEHPDGITLSNWFLRRIEDHETGGTVTGAKTGFVNQSGSCAVSVEEADDGKIYVCASTGSTSSWNCIYDHVYIYSTFAKQTGENS